MSIKCAGILCALLYGHCLKPAMLLPAWVGFLFCEVATSWREESKLLAARRLELISLSTSSSFLRAASCSRLSSRSLMRTVCLSREEKGVMLGLRAGPEAEAEEEEALPPRGGAALLLASGPS
eukprot:CAMPEP_0113944838 /NCGR_PEP_ID=MMETSP1339-20121228/37212_1 /TAXON_ID=94617 /ORGANISM="Fibrocapsa japonica" /LENGTH=122 /DNA_ID=CAMNT_0000950173 /DNA_START=51 /DNA_END=419 /DNA_ORIENTATION=+ /assembly_acc=CAM_ASM_000762